MSDVMLLGVLRAPHQHGGKEFTDYVGFQQLVGAARQAADRIEADADRIAELERENADLLAEVIAEPSATDCAPSSPAVQTMRNELSRRDRLVAAEALEDAYDLADEDGHKEMMARVVRLRREAEGVE